MAFKSELSKALTQTDGAALNPYDLDPVLNDELLNLQPLAQLLEVQEATGRTHEYDVRSSHPQGWFEGEVTPANQKNGVYKRMSTKLKIQRIWGSVSGFTQAMDEKFIDALTAELQSSLEGMSNVLEYGIMWGCDDEIGFTGDAYQYSGIFPRIAKGAPQNIINADGAKVSLDLLDQGVAAVSKYRGVSADPKLWMMGLRMRQVADSLQTRVQIPLTDSVLEDGKITMRNYSNIPIFETDYVVPADETPSPAVTAAQGGNTGALAAGSYKYRIASVTILGEQVAGAASAAAVADATHTVANLSWTADPTAKLYLVFRSVDSGDFKLLDIIPALTYDGEGTVNGTVATYVDAGAKQVISTVEPLETGEQNIVIVNRNPRRGVSLLGKVDDMGRKVDNLFSFVETARVRDSYDYFLKGYLGEMIVHPNVGAAMIRRVKLTA